ncbi:hypothetical protein RHSIM_Rhsim04G0026500 [Rhododendron simsii]|uniref:Uncharacterized protein n=1 Tax=Rhododendron simsii TaxID=118357 RepID=A0A834H0X1_RHOSS|nr:hypothetical protein RHSIM_Rhsim04G0026500 [Rhododendron simsii]
MQASPSWSSACSYAPLDYPNHTTSTHLLPPSNPPQFKKPKRPKKTPPQSDLEWPCNETPADPDQPGWPAPTPAPITRILTPEEQARFAAARIQNKAVAAVEAFFAGNLDSDGEESDEDDEVTGEDGYEEYQFFLKLFTEEEELKGLRGYCEKNWEGGGDFVCLVCGGIGKRKRFKNLVAVVQHSVSIARTKKKNAHRAYAQVVCRVLGWDVDRLPTIDSSFGKPVESQGNAEVAVGESSMINQDLALANVSNGKTIQKEISDVDREGEIPSSSIPGTYNVIGDNVMLCGPILSLASCALQNSVKDGDANECLEKLGDGVQSFGDGNTEGVVTCLEHSEDNDAGNEIRVDQKAIVVVNEPQENNGEAH